MATTDTINLNAVSTGSLVYPSGGSLTITNNAGLGTSPTLVIGPSTVIDTSGTGGITVAGTGFTQISGTIGNTTNPVSGALTKTGSGTLTLTGSGCSVGILNINAGSVVLGGGRLTLTDANNMHLNVGGGSATALTVSGGAVLTTTGTGNGSYIDGAGAVVTGAGSQLLNADYLYVGVYGAGTLLVQSGGSVSSPNPYFGENDGSTGVGIVTGVGSRLTAASALGVGIRASGSLTVQNGGTATAPIGVIGFVPGSAGAVSVTGAGAALTVTGAGGPLFMGEANGSVGGTAQLTVANGGSVVVPGETGIGTSASSITVNGGTFSTGILVSDFGSTPSIYLSDAATAPALTIGTSNFSGTYSGPIADAAGGPGTVNKVGTGTLTLTGVLSNTGGFTASTGTIEFSGATVQPGSGSLTAAAGATIQYDSGARVFGGFLRGPGTQIVTGGATLTGVTTFNSTFVSVTGPASFVNFSNGGTLTIGAGVSTPTTYNGFTNQGSGSITIGAASQINAADYQSYGMMTLNPASGNNFTELMNTGTSPLYFNGGSQTFIGTATAPNPSVVGVDLHGQNLMLAGALFVNNGLMFNSTGGGSIYVGYGALYKGAGTTDVGIITQNGGKVQAGNSPGRASFGQLVFGPGGINNYVFAIDDATGTAGPSPNASGQVSGWGLIRTVQQTFVGVASSGNLTWTATPANPLTISLETLINPTTVGTDVAGPMADFDPTQSYTWPAIQWAGTYSGPTDAAALDASTSFDASGFVNPIEGTFGWSLDSADNTLSLVYTPSAVPEPGTLAMVAAGLGLASFIRRRPRAAR